MFDDGYGIKQDKLRKLNYILTEIEAVLEPLHDVMCVLGRAKHEYMSARAGNEKARAMQSSKLLKEKAIEYNKIIYFLNNSETHLTNHDVRTVWNDSIINKLTGAGWPLGSDRMRINTLGEAIPMVFGVSVLFLTKFAQVPFHRLCKKLYPHNQSTVLLSFDIGPYPIITYPAHLYDLYQKNYHLSLTIDMPQLFLYMPIIGQNIEYIQNPTNNEWHWHGNSPNLCVFFNQNGAISDEFTAVAHELIHLKHICKGYIVGSKQDLFTQKHRDKIVKAKTLREGNYPASNKSFDRTFNVSSSDVVRNEEYLTIAGGKFEGYSKDSLSENSFREVLGLPIRIEYLPSVLKLEDGMKSWYDFAKNQTDVQENIFEEAQMLKKRTESEWLEDLHKLETKFREENPKKIALDSARKDALSKCVTPLNKNLKIAQSFFQSLQKGSKKAKMLRVYLIMSQRIADDSLDKLTLEKFSTNERLIYIISVLLLAWHLICCLMKDRQGDPVFLGTVSSQLENINMSINIIISNLKNGVIAKNGSPYLADSLKINWPNKAALTAEVRDIFDEYELSEEELPLILAHWNRMMNYH